MESKDGSAGWFGQYESLAIGKDEFKELLKAIPSSGLAFRGDALGVARTIKKNGLNTSASNFFVFLPPENIDSLSDLELSKQRELLEAEIDYCLFIADPWRDKQVVAGARELKYYSKFLKDFKERTPAICWFTSPDNERFRAVIRKGDKIGEKPLGDVATFAAIPAESVRNPLFLSWQELQDIELKVYNLVDEKDKDISTIIGSRNFRDMVRRMSRDLIIAKLTSEIKQL